MLPVCAAIHDLSCYAKSSLTVVLPTLEVMGVEACPVPTALLSSQTDGFSSYTFTDTTESLTQILAAWESLGLGFDAIYTGFLGSGTQVSAIRSFIQKQRHHANPLVLVDPVLGDGGALYGPMQESDVEAMRILACDADVITPNVTEAALLLGVPYQAQLDEETARSWARKLSLQTQAKVAITSVNLPRGKAIACFDEGESFLVPYQHLSASYPGCGDLYASLLLGFLLDKESFRTAATAAASYTSLAIERTLACGYEHRHGVMPSLMFADLVQGKMSHGT